MAIRRRRKRNPPEPFTAPVDQIGNAAIRYAEAGGGLTRVLAYQAAEAIKRGRLKAVLTKFEQPALPIHMIYPTSRLLSAKVRTFIDLVVEISDWHFGSFHSFLITRNVPFARAITTPSAVTRLCTKQSVPPVLITWLLTESHWPICAVPVKSTARPTVTSRAPPPSLRRHCDPLQYRQARQSTRHGSARASWCVAWQAAAR